MSGKGGVGKTTISTNIARYLESTGYSVGIMDADLHGPNVLEMLGAKHEQMFSVNNELIPIEINENLKAASISALIDEKDATIWRGPLKHKFIKELIEDVKWGELDYLIVDFPPGTGDEHLSAAQTLKNITGVVIVSTPQSIALSDVKRSIDFCKKLNLPIIGAIENMSGLIFGEGKVEPFCKKEKIDFLGIIKLEKEIADANEKGKPFFTNIKITNTFNKIMMNILTKVKNENSNSIRR